MSRTVQLARKLSRRFFEKRGNNTEVHLKEDDLTVLLGVAVTRGKEPYIKALERIREMGYNSQAARCTDTVLACIRVAEEALLEEEV